MSFGDVGIQGQEGWWFDPGPLQPTDAILNAKLPMMQSAVIKMRKTLYDLL